LNSRQLWKSVSRSDFLDFVAQHPAQALGQTGAPLLFKGALNGRAASFCGVIATEPGTGDQLPHQLVLPEQRGFADCTSSVLAA